MPEKGTLQFIHMMHTRHSPALIIVGLLFLSMVLTACIPGDQIAGSQEAEEGNVTMEMEPVKIVAHRGARSLAPENTVAAAVKALEAGAFGWELDVAMSSDGVLVLLHDDTLERTSNAQQVFPNRSPWSVYEFTLEELKQLDLGSWFVETDPFELINKGIISENDLASYKGLAIDTLEEALLYTKEHNWWVNVEIKDASGTHAHDVIVSKVVSLIGALGMEEQVLISSFNHDYLREVKSLNPDLALGVLVSKCVNDPLSLMQEIGAQAYHPGLKAVDPDQIRLLREAGFDVNVWTVNDLQVAQELIEMGVTGIITDFPQDLISLVSQTD